MCRSDSRVLVIIIGNIWSMPADTLGRSCYYAIRITWATSWRCLRSRPSAATISSLAETASEGLWWLLSKHIAKRQDNYHP
ncbi:hypothetical protein F4861DRAFT_527201 [Xylaria intraflava]|nr:hypothetical protein F4861DRAFT_527201 [Xylaria intraflava]